jgi:hypothetical protein
MRKFHVVAFAVLAVAFSLLCNMNPVDAAGCQNYSYSHRQAYSYTPTYYANQSYSYTPQYQTKYVYQDVLVPYAVKAVYNPDYFFSAVADPYQVAATASRDQLTADAAAFRALKLLVDAGMLPKVTGQQTQATRIGAQIPAPNDPRVPVAPIRGVLPAAGMGGVPAGLQDIVEAKCAACHSGQADRLDLTNLAAVARVDRLDAWSLVHEGSMPKGKAPLTDAEVNIVKAWAKAAKR